MTTFQAKDAKAALAIIGRVIDRRNTIPILGNVMIKASGEKMTISGTDLDIYASAEIDCKQRGPVLAFASQYPHLALKYPCNNKDELCHEHVAA